MKEVWKDIRGFEGIYKISNFGRIKSFKRVEDGYILSNKNSKNGYLSVVLINTNNKKIRYTRIHRLVAEAFIPNPENKREVNHIDGNKQNNLISNLQWATSSENIRHAIKLNPNMIYGMNQYNKEMRPNPIYQYSLDGKFLREYINSAEASKSTGVCRRNILQVASRDEYKPGKTRKQAGGYIWTFKDEGR